MRLSKKEKIFIAVDLVLYIFSIIFVGVNLFAQLLVLVIIGSIFIKWKENNKLPLLQLVLLTLLLISYILIGMAIRYGII